MEIYEHDRNLRGSRRGGCLGQGAPGRETSGGKLMDCEREREALMGERKKQGKHQERKALIIFRWTFLCGFGCRPCVTSSVPSAGKVWELRRHCRSHHSRDLCLTRSGTEKAEFHSSSILEPVLRYSGVTTSVGDTQGLLSKDLPHPTLGVGFESTVKLTLLFCCCHIILLKGSVMIPSAIRGRIPPSCSRPAFPIYG